LLEDECPVLFESAVRYNPKEWPYPPSVNSRHTDRGPQKRKRSGFWQDPRTLTVLRCAAGGCMTYAAAVRRLLVCDDDVQYYIAEYRRDGWPPGGQGCAP
jgi:hypothetical protein